MICDSLSHQVGYRHLHRHFAAGFDWLLALDPRLPDGRYSVVGDDVFALIQSYTTAPAADKAFENHRERIDIQYIVSGTEALLCVPAEGLAVRDPHDTTRDIAFYHEPPAYSSLICGPGMFAIFFPHDAHKPGCIFQAPGPVKKVVLKVRV